MEDQNIWNLEDTWNLNQNKVYSLETDNTNILESSEKVKGGGKEEIYRSWM